MHFINLPYGLFGGILFGVWLRSRASVGIAPASDCEATGVRLKESETVHSGSGSRSLRKLVRAPGRGRRPCRRGTAGSLRAPLPKPLPRASHGPRFASGKG